MESKQDIKGQPAKKQSEEKKTSILSETEDKPKKSEPAKTDKAVIEVRAKARFVRVSPRKVRLVIDALRGKNVVEAMNRLALINKGSVSMVSQLLKSAIANAENNFKLNRQDLYIKHIVADQGPTLHRWKPAAFGSAHPIKKRTSHLSVILAVKENKPVKKSRGKNKAKISSKKSK